MGRKPRLAELAVHRGDVALRIVNGAMTDVSRENLSVAESAGALKDGKVDAFFWIGGIPTSAVQDLAASGQPAVRFISTGTEAVVLQTRYPGLYTPMSLPENAYAGQAAAVEGLGVANVIVVAGGAEDSMVQDVLATIFDNLDAVHAIHPEAAKLALDGAFMKLAVGYHPAAEAFYTARGITAR